VPPERLLTFLDIRQKFFPERLQAGNLSVDLFDFVEQQISYMLARRAASVP
jgi:hypothetical protein